MALKDLVIPTVDVQFAGGSFAVRGLSSTDIEKLLREHGTELKSVWDEFLADGTDLSKLDASMILPIIKKVMAKIPAAIIDIIGLAADADDADLSVISKLPVGLQAQAVGAVLGATLGTDGDWAKTLETAVAMIGSVNGALGELAKKQLSN